MLSLVPFPRTPLHPTSSHRLINFRHSPLEKTKTYLLCSKNNTTSNSSTKQDPNSETNPLLKLAWYSSELLGIAASYLQKPAKEEGGDDEIKLVGDESGVVGRAQVVEAIKKDFLRSYFVTGNLTLGAYEEECEFADPAGSFKGLGRFKRNCTNFGLLVEKSNMKLTAWEDFEVSWIIKHEIQFLNFYQIWGCIMLGHRTWELVAGVLALSYHFLGNRFFLLPDIQSTILIHRQEKFVGIWSTGMFRKWHF